MKVYRTLEGIVVEQNNQFFLVEADWTAFINRSQLHQKILQDLAAVSPRQGYTLSGVLPPITHQEIWASGVTYMRSKEARMEEAAAAGGGDFYARVYDAERPELFFKSTAARAVGHSATVNIRRDSQWNVPEPELTLFMSAEGGIEGYTIGNDMSSRDIEGENPLYLPQAKSYDAAAAIGPCLLREGPIDPDTQIQIEIERGGQSVFAGTVSINRMKRKHTELVEYLFREMSFPQGVYLMTGTGIVPPDDFTLHEGDAIHITIHGIGTLHNTVGYR